MEYTPSSSSGSAPLELFPGNGKTSEGTVVPYDEWGLYICTIFSFIIPVCDRKNPVSEK